MSVAPDGLQHVYLIPKTTIGGYIFDAVFSVDHETSLSLTQHPVESGAAVTDHAIVQPRRATMQIGMTDLATPVNDQFAAGSSRSVNAYQFLVALQASRIPLRVTTRLATLDNMLIERISAPDTNRTAFALRVTVELKEIIVAQVTTVRISARPHVTDSTPRGEQQPQRIDNNTMLKSLADLLGVNPDSLASSLISGLGGGS